MGLPEAIFERLCEEDEKLTLNEAYRKALIMETKINNRTSNNMQVNYLKNPRNYKTNNETTRSKQRN